MTDILEQILKELPSVPAANYDGLTERLSSVEQGGDQK